jgi:hypothetical protein
VFVFTDFARLMDFNYYAQIEDIAPRPTMFIVGTEAATIFMSKAGFERQRNQRSGLKFPAVATLEEFFGRSLQRSPMVTAKRPGKETSS